MDRYRRRRIVVGKVEVGGVVTEVLMVRVEEGGVGMGGLTVRIQEAGVVLEVLKVRMEEDGLEVAHHRTRGASRSGLGRRGWI